MVLVRFNSLLAITNGFSFVFTRKASKRKSTSGQSMTLCLYATKP